MIKVTRQNDKAVLTVYGTIGDKDFSGESIGRHIGELEQTYSSIDMHIHTCGGSVFEGNVIRNIIKNSKAAVDIYIDGLAASMGAIILTAARRVYIAENGFIMIHRPSSSSMGNAEDMEQCAKLLRAMEDDFCRVLCSKTDKADSEIRKLLSGGDHWFDAGEARKLGIVDAVTPCVAKDIQQFDRQSVKALTAENLFMKYSASLNNYQNMSFKTQLTAILKLADSASETDIINAVSGLMETPGTTDQAISRALSMKIITEASANDLRQWGKVNPSAMAGYLNGLEKEKKAESRKQIENLFTENRKKLMGITPVVVAQMKDFASAPENYETIKSFIEQMPEYMTFTDKIQADRSKPDQENRASWKLEDYRMNDPEYLRKNPEFYRQLIENEDEQ